MKKNAASLLFTRLFRFKALALFACLSLSPAWLFAFETDLVFPWIANNAQFQGTLVLNNLNASSAEATLTAVRADGSSQTESLILAPQEQFVTSAGALFDELGPGAGYVVRMTAADGVTGGFVITGTGSASGSSPSQANAVPADRAAAALLFNYMPASSGTISAAVVYNPGAVDANATFRAFRKNTEVARAYRPIKAGAPFAATTDSLFPGLVGDVRLAVESDQPLIGAAFIFNQFLEPSMANAVAIDALPPTLPLQSAEAQAMWREDLRFMVDQMISLHPKLFHSVSREELDLAVRELDELIPGLSDQQIVAGLMKIAALPSRGGRDGHMGLDPLSVSGPDLLPLQVYFFSDGLFVVDAHPDYAAHIGKKIVAIDGRGIEDVARAIDPLLPRDSPAHLTSLRPYLFLEPRLLEAIGVVDDPARMSFQFEDADGGAVTVDLEPLDAEAAIQWLVSSFTASKLLLPEDASVLYLSRMQERFWDAFLPETGTLYIQYNAVADVTQSGETLQAFADRLRGVVTANQVERVVLDMRHNGGGNNTLFGPLVQFLESPEVNVRGRLFVLISRHTFSAAGNLAAEIENLTEALFVGEPTGGSPNQYGDSSVGKLPNSGYQFFVPTLYHQFAAADDPRLSVAPDIAAVLSFEDFRNRNDPALDAVMAYRESK